MKSKWLSELKKIGFLRLGLLAVAAIILIICSLPQNQLSNLNQAGTYSNQAQSMGSSLDTDGDTSLFSYEHELEKRLEQILGGMEGLVQADKCEGVVYNDPIEVAQKMADLLKNEEGCDVVICLSHLGYQLKNTPCDEELAQKTNHIDAILGGHTHSFMKEPAVYLNKDGQNVPVMHTGKSGIYVGMLKLTLAEE